MKLLQSNQGLALGCSHTAGIGIDYIDCYVSLLEKHYKIPIKNFGVPGGNCKHLEQHLVQELKSNRFDFVIAQWPNVFRKTIWHKSKAVNENLQNASTVFRQLLESGEENFYNSWLQTIITCNKLCELAHIPIVNIMIEDIDKRYHNVLNKENIVLHTDQKLPGLTWLMDSQARDKLHHSAHCHRQWADRLIGLIDQVITHGVTFT